MRLYRLIAVPQGSWKWQKRYVVRIYQPFYSKYKKCYIWKPTRPYREICRGGLSAAELRKAEKEMEYGSACNEPIVKAIESCDKGLWMN